MSYTWSCDPHWHLIADGDSPDVRRSAAVCHRPGWAGQVPGHRDYSPQLRLGAHLATRQLPDKLHEAGEQGHQHVTFLIYCMTPTSWKTSMQIQFWLEHKLSNPIGWKHSHILIFQVNVSCCHEDQRYFWCVEHSDEYLSWRTLF